jgi:ubiquinone biosynthesis monooxygenase Coq7
MSDNDIKLRRDALSPEDAAALKKGVRTLHNLETMATNIYRFQITREPCERNRQLIAAMCNEMTHMQDFQVKLFEYGWKPGIMRIWWWWVGFVFGFGTRLLGPKAMLKLGIWVETKAVHHYDELKKLPWDEDGMRIMEKDQADEYGHINRWKHLLSELTG